MEHALAGCDLHPRRAGASRPVVSAFLAVCGLTFWLADGLPMEMLAHRASVLAATDTDPLATAPSGWHQVSLEG